MMKVIIRPGEPDWVVRSAEADIDLSEDGFFAEMPDRVAEPDEASAEAVASSADAARNGI